MMLPMNMNDGNWIWLFAFHLRSLFVATPTTTDAPLWFDKPSAEWTDTPIRGCTIYSVEMQWILFQSN